MSRDTFSQGGHSEVVQFNSCASPERMEVSEQIVL